MTLHEMKAWVGRFALVMSLWVIPGSHAAALSTKVLNLPFPYSDSPNLIETTDGILMVWSGGTRPGHSDVSIRQSHWDGTQWSAPRLLTSYVEKRNGVRQACWNPVLVQGPDSQLAVFYQVGVNRETWKGRVKFSYDGGHSWTRDKSLPRGIHGPINGKAVALASGKLLCPSSDEGAGWRVQLEYANPFRESWGWRSTKPLNFPGEYRATDPVILLHDPQHIQVLCRSKQGYITEIWTDNGAKTWQPMQATSLPNPNSAFDVVKMFDGRFLLVYNHSATLTHRLHVAVSENGKDWEAVGVLDHSTSEHFANPSVIQAMSGRIHIVYAVNQTRLKHVQLDPTQFQSKPIVDGNWPVQ